MKSSTTGAGCLVLFALPFALVGTGALVGFARALSHDGPAQVTFMLGLFGLVFSAAGYGLIAGAVVGRKRAARAEELRQAHPGQPWMWNEEWASRRIGDSNRSGTVFLWVFAVMWNGISAPLFFSLRNELEKKNFLILLALLFPIIGVFLIIAAVRGTLRALRFKRSTLVLDQVPVPLGGTLRGHIEVPYEPLAEASSIILRLTAVNRRSSGKNTTESIVFQEDAEVARASVSRMPDRVSIPVAIDIPLDGPETDTDGVDQSHWRLTVDAEVPGIDYSATFNVPVFRTAQTPQLRPQTARTPPPEPREPSDFSSRHTPEGRELYFGRFRARGMAMGMLLITLVWTIVVAVLFVADAPWFFAIIFGLIDLLLIAGTLDLFFGSSLVLLGMDRVVVRQSLFRTTETVLRRDEIVTAAAKIAGQGGGRPYYEVEVRTAAGKKLTAGKYLRSKREAEWVASQIRGALDSAS